MPKEISTLLELRENKIYQLLTKIIAKDDGILESDVTLSDYCAVAFLFVWKLLEEEQNGQKEKIVAALKKKCEELGLDSEECITTDKLNHLPEVNWKLILQHLNSKKREFEQDLQSFFSQIEVRWNLILLPASSAEELLKIAERELAVVPPAKGTPEWDAWNEARNAARFEEQSFSIPQQELIFNLSKEQKNKIDALLLEVAQGAQLDLDAKKNAPKYNLQGYRRYQLPGNECGCTAFGMTSAQACDLLKKNINFCEVPDLVKMDLKWLLATETFRNYLITHFVKQDVLKNIIADAIKNNLNTYVAHPNVFLAYIDYVLADKKYKEGWISLAVLEMLANAKKIKIYMWTLGEDKRLIYHDSYIGKGAEQRIDILWRDDFCDFEKLDFVGFKDLPAGADFVVNGMEIYPYVPPPPIEIPKPVEQQKSEVLASTFFEKNNNNGAAAPAMAAEHNSKKGYIRHNNAPDDKDSDYTAFGITRAQAYNLLKSHIRDDKVLTLLQSEIGQLQGTQEFCRYLARAVEKDITFERMQNKLEGTDKNPEVALQYIKYVVEDKKYEQGSTHPVILQALAHIQKIEIHMWEFGKNQCLIPSRKQYYDYAFYKPQGAEQRLDLLVINGGYFERLELVGFEKENLPTAADKDAVIYLYVPPVEVAKPQQQVAVSAPTFFANNNKGEAAAPVKVAPKKLTDEEKELKIVSNYTAADFHKFEELIIDKYYNANKSRLMLISGAVQTNSDFIKNFLTLEIIHNFLATKNIVAADISNKRLCDQLLEKYYPGVTVDDLKNKFASEPGAAAASSEQSSCKR